MKKFMIVVVLVFAFALTMNVAFAEVGCPQCQPQMDNCLCPSTTVTSLNVGGAVTSATANSSSGLNGVSKIYGGASIYTGAALSQVVGQSQANDNNVDVTVGPFGKLTVFSTNMGNALTSAVANSETGKNGISCAGTSVIQAGAASSYVTATSLVNTNMVKVKR
jgi:hypothetical protein